MDGHGLIGALVISKAAINNKKVKRESVCIGDIKGCNKQLKSLQN